MSFFLAFFHKNPRRRPYCAASCCGNKSRAHTATRRTDRHFCLGLDSIPWAGEKEGFSRGWRCSKVATETKAIAGASCIQHVSAVSLELSSLRMRTNAFWTHRKKAWILKNSRLC